MTDSITLTGRVITLPSLRQQADDHIMGTFIIESESPATDYRPSLKINITVWDDLAKTISTRLQLGMKVTVSGVLFHLKSVGYLEVVADSVSVDYEVDDDDWSEIDRRVREWK